jgi:membrane protein DedA with SNARE-associated domain
LQMLGAVGCVAIFIVIMLGLGQVLRHVDVQRLIREYGLWFYVFTFGWTFIEGETFVLVAGFAAAQGLLSAPLLLLAAWIGSFAGDQSYFWIGRRYGLRLLSHRPRWRGPVDTALSWVKRYDKWFILSFRFIYGIRNFSSFALGISGISWRRFLVLNFLAALLWASAFVGAGYFCGRALEHFLGAMADDIAEEVSVFLLCGFIAIIGSITIVHRLRARRRKSEAQATAEAPPTIAP